MKSKTSKDLWLIIILIPVFLWCAFFINNRFNDKLPSYSVINKSKTGTSIYFEALKELDMPVERSMRSIDSSNTDIVQIVAQGGNFDINSSEAKKWVEAGGTLVYLEPGDLHIISYEVLPEIKGNLFIYKFKKGTVIAVNALGFTNKTFLTNKKDAYNLISELGSYSYSKISFNEYYLFETAVNTSLWDYIPLWLKFIIYQLIIVIMLVFYYKGKRFGKTIPLYEEVERRENEYLYSAAALYKHARCYDLIFNSFYKNFISKMNCNDENWIEYWEKEKLPSVNKAMKVYEFVKNRNARTKSREYIQMIVILEQLEGILNKRSDLYWEVLKKTL